MVKVVVIVDYDFMILMTTFWYDVIVIVIVFGYIDGKAALLFLLTSTWL
jgi:hypothetical protein